MEESDLGANTNEVCRRFPFSSENPDRSQSFMLVLLVESLRSKDYLCQGLGVFVWTPAVFQRGDSMQVSKFAAVCPCREPVRNCARTPIAPKAADADKL